VAALEGADATARRILGPRSGLRHGKATGRANWRCASADPSHHTRGVVSWVPRRICGACPSRPGRWCQAERGRTTARMIRL